MSKARRTRQASAAHADDRDEAHEEDASHGSRLLQRIVQRYGDDPDQLAEGVAKLSDADEDAVMHAIQTSFGNSASLQVAKKLKQIRGVSMTSAEDLKGQINPPGGTEDLVARGG